MVEVYNIAQDDIDEYTEGLKTNKFPLPLRHWPNEDPSGGGHDDSFGRWEIERFMKRWTGCCKFWCQIVNYLHRQRKLRRENRPFDSDRKRNQFYLDEKLLDQLPV